MRKLVKAIISTISIFATMPVVARAADLLDFETNYTISGDFGTSTGAGCRGCGTFHDTVLLDPAAQKFDGGLYQITEATMLLGGGAEFAEFYVTRTDGGPLVANGSTNANTFQITLDNIQLTASAVRGNPYLDFATNGANTGIVAANTGIVAFGGFGIEANPNSSSIGAGKNAFFYTVSDAPSTTTHAFQSIGSFSSAVAQGKFDPNATGYFVGFELIPAPSPIPGAGLLSYIALGVLGLGSLGWKKLRPA